MNQRASASNLRRDPVSILRRFDSETRVCPQNQLLLCPDGSAPLPGVVQQCETGEVVVQGNRMFSQHAIHTADLPFIDVDNLDGRFPHISDLPSWKFSPAFTDPGSNLLVPPIPESAMVQSVIAAYPCWSGSSNLPPTFVAALDAVPAATGLVALAAGFDDVSTEVDCEAGAVCAFPLFAQDFDFAFEDSGTLDVRTAANCYSRSGTLPQPLAPDAGYQSCDVVQVLVGSSRPASRASFPSLQTSNTERSNVARSGGGVLRVRECVTVCAHQSVLMCDPAFASVGFRSSCSRGGQAPEGRRCIARCVRRMRPSRACAMPRVRRLPCAWEVVVGASSQRRGQSCQLGPCSAAGPAPLMFLLHRGGCGRCPRRPLDAHGGAALPALTRRH